MWCPICSAFLVACLFTLTLAHPPTNTTYPSAAEILRLLPPCAAQCLTAIVPGSSCSVTDVRCICTNRPIQEAAEKCILKECTVLADALSANNITAISCHAPVRDRSGQYAAVALALGAITVLVVAIRLIFKQFFAPDIGLAADDKVIMVTLVLRISCIVINVKGLAAHGLGKDTWTLTIQQLTVFTKWLYIMEVLYPAEISLIKLSLSLFYVRIFPCATIRRLLWATVIVNILYGIVFVITPIFQCTPIDYFWKQYFEDHATGKCININALGWANAAMGVALDLWMISIPLSQISKLQLHWTKKVVVVTMFVLGAFVTVVSILRLSSLVSWANSTNPTWDQWHIVYWSTVEVNVGMICTSLPSIRLIVTRAFPNLTRSESAHGGNSLRPQESGRMGPERRTTVRDHRLPDFDQHGGHIWERIESEAKQ